jgi:hypothetical protein
VNESTKLSNDLFREELIRSGGDLTFGLIILEEEIKNMHYYLKTMEEFIEQQRKSEIEQLKQQTKNLTEEQCSKFWVWHYPVHWDEIFASRLRSSFLISLISFTEIKINQICRAISIIVRSEINSSDLRGNIWDRSKKYLNNFGKFTKPSNDDWALLIKIYDVRNVFVHHNGDIRPYNNFGRLKKFIKENNALSESHEFIEVEKDFCFFCLSHIDSFLKTLTSEVRKLCDHVIKFESK